MRSFLKWLGIVLGAIVVLLVVFAGYVFLRASSKLSHKYENVQGKNLYVNSDSATIARGHYVAETFGGCTACHGRNLGGESIDAMPFAKMNKPNITFGNGGLPQGYTVTDLDLAIRHGIKRDKTGMMMMPAYHLNRMADEDVAAIYAYLKTAPRVDQSIPPYELGPIGKMVLTMGGISLQPELTDHNFKPGPLPTIEPNANYGRYLAEVTCMGCHAPNYSGGPVYEGEPTWPPASNLTSVLKQYNANTFASFMKTGKRPNGTLIDTRPMPTDIYREFGEVEVAALWSYLASLPSLPDASANWQDLLTAK